MTHDSWDFESGLPDFEATVKDAYWTTDPRFVNQRSGELTTLLKLIWDAPSKDGGTYERNQYYTVGDGWEISADGRFIEPDGKKINKRSIFAALAIAAGNADVSFRNANLKDASIWKDKTFKFHYQTVGKGTTDYPLPAAGSEIGEVAAGPEIDPELKASLEAIAKEATDHDDFLLKALEKVAGDNELESVVSASGPGSLYAEARA